MKAIKFNDKQWAELLLAYDAQYRFTERAKRQKQEFSKEDLETAVWNQIQVQLMAPVQNARQQRVGADIEKAFKGVFDANAGATAKIPTRPTHVVIKAADLFANAGGRGVAIRKLSPGLLVTVLETKGGWVLVAKDGSKRGFVERTKLAPVR